MKRFVLSKTAERDLVEIKRYLIHKAGPRITHRVIKDIRSALGLLGSRPGLDEPSSQVLAGLLLSDCLDPGSKPIRIIRVLHGMRDLKEILT